MGAPPGRAAFLQHLRLALLALLLTNGLTAQMGFATVTAAGENERVWGARPYQRATARSGDGVSFVLVLRTSTSLEHPKRDLEVWSSAGGKVWRKTASLPTTNDGLGCLAAEAERARLHFLWNARDGAEWSSVFHAVLDLQTLDWVAPPTCLARGTGPNDQYFANDLCFVGGKLAASIGAHRAPQTKGYSAWCSCLRVLEDLDGFAWSDPQSLHVGSAAVSANLSSFDGVLHSAFRTYAGGDHCIATRRWLAEDNRFREGVVRVAPLAGETRRHTNHGLLGIDQDGHRYVLTALGTTNAVDGRIVVSHAAPGGEAWLTSTIDDDPPIKGGNTDVLHIALAKGPGNQMLAFYSKVSEEYANLYLQVLDDGSPLGKPRRVGSGAAGAFEQLSGGRDTTRVAGVQLVITAGARTTAAKRAPNEVRVYGILR